MKSGISVGAKAKQDMLVLQSQFQSLLSESLKKDGEANHLKQELNSKNNYIAQKDVEISAIRVEYEKKVQLLQDKLSQYQTENTILQSKLCDSSQALESLAKSTEELQADKKDLRKDKFILQEQNNLLQSQIQQLKEEVEISFHTSQLSLSDMPHIQESASEQPDQNILDQIGTVESIELSGEDSSYVISEDAHVNI